MIFGIKTVTDAGVVITAFGIIGGVMLAIFKKNKKIEDNNTDIIDIKATLAQFVNDFKVHSEKTDLLLKEFKPNGSSTFRDLGDRLEKNSTRIEQKLDRLEVQTEFNKVALKSILHDNPNSGYIITNEEGETIEVSNSVCVMLQKQEDDLLKHKWLSYVHPSDKPRVLAAIQSARVMKNDMNEDWRFEVSNKGNRRVYIKTNNYAKQIYVGDRFVGYYITVTKLS